MDRFLTGWATPPTLFEALLPRTTHIIDTTELLPHLLESETLKETWIAKTIALTGIERGDAVTGFSTGAILALAIATQLPISVTLYAPTLSFVQRDGYPHGFPIEAVEQMRKGLETSQEITLKRFLRDCKLNRASIDTHFYSQKSLDSGLLFLEQVSLCDTSLSSVDAKIFHSGNDKIIPFTAGEEVAKKCNTTINEIPGGHGAIVQHLTL